MKNIENTPRGELERVCLGPGVSVNGCTVTGCMSDDQCTSSTLCVYICNIIIILCVCVRVRDIVSQMLHVHVCIPIYCRSHRTGYWSLRIRTIKKSKIIYSADYMWCSTCQSLLLACQIPRHFQEKRCHLHPHPLLLCPAEREPPPQ